MTGDGGQCFKTVTPCRVYDSRGIGDPPLISATPRDIQIVDLCGIPPSATAVSLNVTIVDPTGSGFLKLYPGTTEPDTSTLNFGAGRTRANNAVVGLLGGDAAGQDRPRSDAGSGPPGHRRQRLHRAGPRLAGCQAAPRTAGRPGSRRRPGRGPPYAGLSSRAAHGAPAAPASVVLVTLDTTRADAVGAAGGARFPGGPARTRRFDALAKGGVRFARALSPSPLTLPAHASLLTGLEPREHGLRDNGGGRLLAEPPTLAALFAAAGYRTGAFVASRVLDRRFGLGRGFAVYDDRMAAEQVGDSGDPERDAVAVTTAALAWARGLPAGTRFFLWVHYYDAHSPYAPPAELAGDGSAGARYAGEVALVDRELGRLLDGLPGAASGRLIAVVGDHGEALGEHGEPGHGVLLHRATLEVPLVIAGPGVPAGRVVTAAVGTPRLAATLVHMAGIEVRPGVAGTPLPLLTAPAAEPIYSETFFPANAYGWSPLRAITVWPWRLVVGRRGELFDLERDAAETRDLVGTRRDVARRLKSALEAFERAHPERRAPAVGCGP